MSHPSTEQHILTYLYTLEPLRKKMLSLNSNTACITFMSLIEEAISYYRQKVDVLPIFVLADWKGDNGINIIENIINKYNVVIIPMNERKSITKEFCLYAKPSEHYFCQWGLVPLVRKCLKEGLYDFYIDQAVLSPIWTRSPNPKFICERFDDIVKIYKSLSDDSSRDVFLRAIKCIATGDPGFLPISNYAQYQHPLAQAEDGDIVIEGGCERGFSTKMFAERVGKSGQVIGFEPLKRFYEACNELLKNYKNVKIENMGLWSNKDKLYIKDKSGGSQITNQFCDGVTEVNLIDIDQYLMEKTKKCSLIKLDIEGSEFSCLRGAFNTIYNLHPKLHICIYHKSSDYIDIPLFIINNFNYKLYMGHHNCWYSETVLYCVPT